jgi:hypothetical protein
MVYIEEDSEMGQALKDSIDTVYTFRIANHKVFWDLAPEGTGLEAWSEDEDLFDWEERLERLTVDF